jgi:hypothetical protein
MNMHTITLEFNDEDFANLVKAAHLQNLSIDDYSHQMVSMNAWNDKTNHDRFNQEFVDNLLAEKRTEKTKSELLDWFNKPNPDLENLTPLEFLDSRNGYTQIYELLGRKKRGSTIRRG